MAKTPAREQSWTGILAERLRERMLDEMSGFPHLDDDERGLVAQAATEAAFAELETVRARHEREARRGMTYTGPDEHELRADADEVGGL